MTHSVVQSDIEVAKQLMDEGSVDTGIIACLCWRGLERVEAVRVVDYLRHGRLADTQPPLVLSAFDRQWPRTAHRRHHHRSPRVMTRRLVTEPLLLAGRRPFLWSRL